MTVETISTIVIGISLYAIPAVVAGFLSYACDDPYNHRQDPEWWRKTRAALYGLTWLVWLALAVVVFIYDWSKEDDT